MLISTSTTANERYLLLIKWHSTNLSIQQMADLYGVTFLEMAHLLDAAILERKAKESQPSG